ncbi:hypothetical protein R3P38DRAFT_3306158 [Favolaschia claudopus]|uniref:Uncharacterized protein n=1 Tax=Favolaschia claudopus TaxID=2862362 RepID=A0AAW0DMY1_9AGAR
MFLTVGSPTLAAYSLAITVLNGHWMLNELAEWLNYVHTWSISAVASILWVIIAYVFTVVDSFTGVVTFSTLNANGQAVGSVFLWLLPVVIAWLQISPKCDSDRVHQAIDKANKIAYVATLEGEPVLASTLSARRAINLPKGSGEVRHDEMSTPPIYNYARFFPWTLAVEHVYYAFREASEKSNRHQPVSGRNWERGDKNTRVHHLNRRGTSTQITAYVKDEPAKIYPKLRSRWGSGVFSRFLVAALMALGLTWGTTGAAIIVAFLRRREVRHCTFCALNWTGMSFGSYLIYGINSTLVWIMMVTSSVLAHYSTFTVSFKGRYKHTTTTRLAGVLSILLRRMGKVLASLNTVWIILTCLFQFGSFFDRCWCDSSVFYLGAKNAYNVIDLGVQDVSSLNAPWIGGSHSPSLTQDLSHSLISGCALVFLGFVNVLINPALPD